MQDVLTSSGLVLIQQMEMLRHIMNGYFLQLYFYFQKIFSVLKRYAPFDDEFQGLVDLLDQMKFGSHQASNCSSSSGNSHWQDSMGG